MVSRGGPYGPSMASEALSLLRGAGWVPSGHHPGIADQIVGAELSAMSSPLRRRDPTAPMPAGGRATQERLPRRPVKAFVVVPRSAHRRIGGAHADLFGASLAQVILRAIPCVMGGFDATRSARLAGRTARRRIRTLEPRAARCLRALAAAAAVLHLTE